MQWIADLWNSLPEDSEGFTSLHKVLEIHWSVETACIVGSSWAHNNWWLGEY